MTLSNWAKVKGKMCIFTYLEAFWWLFWPFWAFLKVDLELARPFKVMTWENWYQCQFSLYTLKSPYNPIYKPFSPFLGMIWVIGSRSNAKFAHLRLQQFSDDFSGHSEHLWKLTLKMTLTELSRSWGEKIGINASFHSILSNNLITLFISYVHPF